MTSISRHEVLSKRRSNQFVNSDKTSQKDEVKTQTNKRQATRIPRNNARVLSERIKTSKESGNKLKSKDIFKYTDGYNNDEPSMIGDKQISTEHSIDNNEQNAAKESTEQNCPSSTAQVESNDEKLESQTKEKNVTQDNTEPEIVNELAGQNEGKIVGNSNLINDPDNPLNRSDQENISVEQQNIEVIEKQRSVISKSKIQTQVPNKTVKKSVLGEKSLSKPKSQLPKSQSGQARSQTNRPKSEIQSKQTKRMSTNNKQSISTTDTKVRRSKSSTPSDDCKTEVDDQSKCQPISQSKLCKPTSSPTKDRTNLVNKTSNVSKTVSKTPGIKANEPKNSRIKEKPNVEVKAGMKLSKESLSEHNKTYENGNNLEKGPKSTDQAGTKIDSSMNLSSHSNNDRVNCEFSKNNDCETTVSTKSRKKSVSVTETRTSVMRRSRSRSVTPGSSSVSSDSSHSNKSASSGNASKTSKISRSSISEEKCKTRSDSDPKKEKSAKTTQSTTSKPVQRFKSYMRTTESMKNKQSRSSNNSVNTFSSVKRQMHGETQNNHIQIRVLGKTSEINANKSERNQKGQPDSMGNNPVNHEVHKNTGDLPLVKTDKSIESTHMVQSLPVSEKCEQKNKLINTQRPQNNSPVKPQIRKALASERNDSQIKNSKSTKISPRKGSKIPEKSLLPPRGKRETLQNSNISANKLSNKPKLSAIKSDECKTRTTVHKSKLITPLPKNMSNHVSRVSKQNSRSISTSSDSHENSKSGKIGIAQRDQKSKRTKIRVENSGNIDNSQGIGYQNKEINIKSVHQNTEEISEINRSDNIQSNDKTVLSNSRKMTDQDKRQLSREGNGDCVYTEHLLENGELDCSENNIVLQEKPSKNGNQRESGIISEFFPSSNTGDVHSLIQIRDRFEVMNDKNSVSMETVCAIASECNEMSETGHCSVVRIDKLSRTLSDSQLSNVVGIVLESTQNISGSLIEEPCSCNKMQNQSECENVLEKGSVDRCQLEILKSSVSPGTEMNESEILDHKPISDNYGANKICDKNAERNHQNERFNTARDARSFELECESFKEEVDQTNNASQMCLNTRDIHKNCLQMDVNELSYTHTDIQTKDKQFCFENEANESIYSKSCDDVTQDKQYCDITKKIDMTVETCPFTSSENESVEFIEDKTIGDHSCHRKTSLNENTFRNSQNSANLQDSTFTKGVCIYSKINDDDRINSYILMESEENLRHQTADEGCISEQNDNKNDKTGNIMLCYTGASGSFKTDKSQIETQNLNSQSILCKDGNNDKPLSDNSRSLSNQTSGESHNIDKGMQDCLELQESITEQSLSLIRDRVNCLNKTEYLNFGNNRNNGTCLESSCQATCANPEVQETLTCNKIEENDKQKVLSLLDNNRDKFPGFDLEERENYALNCPEISASSQPPIKSILPDDNKIPRNLELFCDNSAITNEQGQEIFVSGVAESGEYRCSSTSTTIDIESVQDKGDLCDVKVISAINGENPENSESRFRVGNMDLLDSCTSSEFEHLNVNQMCANEGDPVTFSTQTLHEIKMENRCDLSHLDLEISGVNSSRAIEKVTTYNMNNESAENCLQEQDYIYVRNFGMQCLILKADEKENRNRTESPDGTCSDLLHKQINLNGSDLCDVYTQNSISKSSIMENMHQCKMAENDIKINGSTRVIDNQAQISQTAANLFTENDSCSKTGQNSHFLNCCVEKNSKCDSDKEIKFLESKNKCDVVKFARQRDSQSCTVENHGKIEEFESSEHHFSSYQTKNQQFEPLQDTDAMNFSLCKSSEFHLNNSISEQNAHISADYPSNSQNEINLDHSVLNKDLLYEGINTHSSEPISSTDHLTRMGDMETMQKEITSENFENCLPSELTQCSIITQMNINCNSLDQRENASRSYMDKLASGSPEFGFDRDTSEHAEQFAHNLEKSRDLCLTRLTDLDNRCEPKSYNPNADQDFPGDEMSDLSRVEFISQTCSRNQIVSENSTLPGDLPELNSTDQNSNQTRVICSVEADNSTCASHSRNNSDSKGFQKGGHDSKLEFVYNSQTIIPDIFSDSIKSFNFEANDTGNQCINFKRNQSRSFDTVQQDGDDQFNKTQTFDVRGLQHGDKNELELPGSLPFDTVLKNQNVLDYDVIDGQIFDKCEYIPGNVIEIYTGRVSPFAESEIKSACDVQDQFPGCIERKDEIPRTDLQSDNSDIICGNLQIFERKSEHGTFLNNTEPELKSSYFQRETENGNQVYDDVISKQDDKSPLVRKKYKFIKSSSLSNFRSSDFVGIELTTSSSSQQELSAKTIPLHDTSSGICDNAGEALCDNISDITDIFEDSGDNFVDAEETFDTDIDTTDIDITNSSSCASDLYKQDETLHEPEVINEKTDVTSGIVINVETTKENNSGNVEVYQCRESVTSTESFQDAFDDFIYDCVQKSISGDKTPENENHLLQVSSNLPLDSQTICENGENFDLVENLLTYGDDGDVILSDDNMERRRRREVSAITTIVTGSSVPQHVRSAEYRNLSAIKDNSYQLKTSSTKFKESQHIIESQVFRSTDSSNESGQKVIENVINKTGNEELPVLLCSIRTTGENRKVELTPYSNMQNQARQSSENVSSKKENLVFDDVEMNKYSTEVSEVMPTVTSAEDVERQIETAVTIRTQRRRRRQVQKTETVSEIKMQPSTVINNESVRESVEDKTKIDPDNSALILSRSVKVTHADEPVSVYIDQRNKTTDPTLNDSNHSSCLIENDPAHTEFNLISMSDPENLAINEQSTDLESVLKPEQTSESENGIILNVTCSEFSCSNELNNEVQIFNEGNGRNSPTLTCISSDENTVDSATKSNGVFKNEQTFTISVQTVQDSSRFDDLDDIEYIDADDIPEVNKSVPEGQQDGLSHCTENKTESPNASFTVTFEIASDDECQSIEIVRDCEESREKDDIKGKLENVDVVVNQPKTSENDVTVYPELSSCQTPEPITEKYSKDNIQTEPLNAPEISLTNIADRTELHVQNKEREQDNILQSDEVLENQENDKPNTKAVNIQLKPISESNNITLDNDILSYQDIAKTSCEADESDSVVSEESNISVALALKLEREKLNEFNNNSVNAEDCNRSRSRTCQGKRNTRSASTGNFLLQLESSETDNPEMLGNIKAGLSRRSIKKSSSFRIDRQNVYSPVDDGNIENMETIKSASRKVTDICRSFVQKARSSSRPREQEKDERVISPTPQRKLMKWVNAKGKWLRIPVNESLDDRAVANYEENNEIDVKSDISTINIEQNLSKEVNNSEKQIGFESIVNDDSKAKIGDINVIIDDSNSEVQEEPMIDTTDVCDQANTDKLDRGFENQNHTSVSKETLNEGETIDKLSGTNKINVSSSHEITAGNDSRKVVDSNNEDVTEANDEVESEGSKPDNESQSESVTLEIGPKLVFSPTKTKPKLYLDINKATEQVLTNQFDSIRPSTAPVELSKSAKQEFPVMNKNDFLLGIKDDVSRRSLVKMLSPTRSPIKSPETEFSTQITSNDKATDEILVSPLRIPKLTAVKIQEEIFEGKPEYMKECNIDPLGIVSEKVDQQVSTISEHRKSRQSKDIKKAHTFTSLEDAKRTDISTQQSESADKLLVQSDIKDLDLNSDRTFGKQLTEAAAVNEGIESKTSTNADKRKMKLPVVLRDRSLQRPKLLSEILEVEENKDDSLQTAHNIRSRQTEQQQPIINKKERRLRKSGTTGNKRRSLSLPTGSLAFGDTRIVYKNGHFTFETMDDYKKDSSRPPDLSDEEDPSSESKMHVTVDSSPRIVNASVIKDERRDVTENQRPGLKRQCAKTILTKRDSDDNVFYNTDHVTAFNGQRNESYSNSSHTSDMSLDSLGSEDHELENDQNTYRKTQQSSSSLPESGSSPTTKHEALRARRTSSFRRAQEAGTLDLISEQNGGAKLKQSDQNSPSSQKSIPKRKSLNDNMTLFSKQSESAKDFFSKRMNLKGLFKKNKPEISLPSCSPLKTQHPVSPPIAAFQGDDDIGSIDTPPSSPGPNKDFRRRHTSADIYIKSFADASASEFGSNCPTPTQERHSNKQTLSTPTTPCHDSNSVTSMPSNSSVCSLDDDRISLTSACSATSSSNSVQSPPMEQPHKPKTPKPVGASPRRSHSIGSQGSRTSYISGNRERSSTSVTSLESDNCDSVLSDFIVEGHCECEQRLSELMLRPDKKVMVDFTQLCQFCKNFLEYANSVGLFDGAKAERQRKNSSNKEISGDGNSSAKMRKDSTSRKSLEKLAIMSQTAVVSSNSNDSGIQRDVSAHSSNESIKGTQDGQVFLRRKKSPSPQTERPKSEAGVRWADLDLDASEFHQPVRLRRHAQVFKDRPRPKSDLDDSIQLFDELFDEILEDFETEGSSFLSERMKAFGSEIDLQPYCSLRNLYDMRKRDFDKRKNRRMSTPHPIKSRLHRSPRKLQKQPPLVRSSSMPESLDKISKQRKLHLLDYHMDSLQRHLDAEDCLSDDSDLSFDHASLQERSLSIQSSQSQLTSMDEDEDNLIYAEALWDHITMVPDEIAFRAQDVIEVMDMRDKDWWYGTIDDKEGWFPAAFVRLRVNQDQIEEDVEITLQETLTSSPKSRRISVLNKNQARTNVVNEIINAEREYVKHLKDVVEGYIQHARKRKEMFPEERIGLIFGNIETIYSFAQKFLAHLEKCIDVCPHLSEIGQCFLDNERGFEVYSDYCNNHPSACEELKELCLDSKYRHFFEACRLLQELVEIPLEGFLLTPVQKICKYPLQLAELLKYTPPDHPDYTMVKDALSAMRKIATLINERKRKMESIEKIAAWQHTVVDWEGDDLLERSSELIFSGDINKVNTAGWSQERYFFLFDHQLIYCKKELLKRHVFSYKGRIDLDQCEVIDIPDGRDTQYNVSVKHGWKLHETNKDKWYLLYGKTLAVKERWLKALNDERKRVKEDRDNDFCVPDHWKQTVLNKVRSQSSLKDKHPTSRVNPSHQVPYQKDLKDFTYSTLPRRRLNSQNKDKKKGWFLFGGKKSKR